MEAPQALWATISENKSEVKPLYASMAGDDPASGKNWSSKPKQQVNAWNRTMQHTYHTYIPESYQTLPSKAATIRASSAASSKEQKFKGYSEEFLSLAKFTHFLLKCWWWPSNFWLGHFLQEERVSSINEWRSMKLFFEAPFLNQRFPNFQRRLVEVWWTGKGRHERCEEGLPSAQPFGWWVKHAKAQWICRQATERVQEINCNPYNAGFDVGLCNYVFFFCGERQQTPWLLNERSSLLTPLNLGLSKKNRSRYASKEHSHDTAYETYLKEYGGSEKGQDGEKYISGSSFAPSHDSEGANGWADGSWNKKYESGAPSKMGKEWW